MANEMKEKLEDILQEKILTETPLGGGCIANSKKIKTELGKTYLLKQYDDKRIHKTEANGLIEIKKAEAIRVPEVISVSEDYLLVEFINQGNKGKEFSEEFGRQLADLHRYENDLFGFFENNFIGSNEQINQPQCTDWATFYWDNRLMYQFRLAEKNGYVTDELRKAFLQLENKIHEILDDIVERPSLLHGDLWGGNYIVDEFGKPVLIDPAVYYGHREADLAMTKIFGGFDSAFYSAYHEALPLQNGYKERENIYKLYHIFNHLNLFGGTYYEQTVNLIKYYL